MYVYGNVNFSAVPPEWKCQADDGSNDKYREKKFRTAGIKLGRGISVDAKDAPKEILAGLLAPPILPQHSSVKTMFIFHRQVRDWKKSPEIEFQYV